MSTLLEIEAVADTLPPEQQAELVTFLSARLARAGGVSNGRGDAWVDLEQEFLRLAQQWRAKTEFSSSLTEMAAHPAYQRIIGMGCLALPMIFRELAAEPDHWFWALKASTGCDPVLPPHRGNLEMMAADWPPSGLSRRSRDWQLPNPHPFGDQLSVGLVATGATKRLPPSHSLRGDKPHGGEG